MKYSILIILLFVCISFEANAQRWHLERRHVSIGIGASGFMGDLGGADDIGSNGLSGIRDFDFGAVRPAITVGYRYMLFENLGLTGNLAIGYVSGDDQLTDEPFRNNRNIHFRSPIIELSATGELYVFRLYRDGQRYRRITRVRANRGYGISAYIFAGIAGFYFNPQAYFDADNYNGTIPQSQLPANGWYNLRPLRTEGQGFFPTRSYYNQFSIAIPLGIGGIYHINRDISIGIQYGFRTTFTDYIDDVSTTYVDPAIFHEIFEDASRIALAEHFANPTNNSLSKSSTAPGQQRGSPFNNDAYMFGFITLYYRISDTRRTFGR